MLSPEPTPWQTFAAIHAEVDPVLEMMRKAETDAFSDVVRQPIADEGFTLTAYRGVSLTGTAYHHFDRTRKKTEHDKHSKSARDGEVTLGKFIMSKAREAGLAWQTIYQRYRLMNFSGLNLRRVNARMVFVSITP